MKLIKLEGHSLKKYQNAVLSVAVDVIEVLEKEHIKYSLTGGSALGAVRHKGFIPWDDDIDINIPREDYNKLLRVFDKYLGNDYYIQTPLNSPQIGLLLTQIRKKNTIAKRKYDLYEDEKKCGISIDLYVVENVFNNKSLRWIQTYFSLFFAFIVSCNRSFKNRGIPKQVFNEESRKLKYGVLKYIIGFLSQILPLTIYIKLSNVFFSLCKNNKSKYVSVPSGRKHFNGELDLRENLCKYRKCRFENEFFNIPFYAEKYLEKFYGNYMKIPLEEKREQHIFLKLEY
ncbi:LicD family protein [Lactobacillus sp. UCMA15818]|uniref:LicD family protein n=1 Tax=Lactobacillus sp. UCMA15818 TaxID=2583394 RepID=UPI0025AF1D6D|nr:LicD family protein [Lactobacillus sp. UCMA15818]MDN2452995.1 LicD family protein [Lactobacillus sp. UCMA15818]